MDDPVRYDVGCGADDVDLQERKIEFGGAFTTERSFLFVATTDVTKRWAASIGPHRNLGGTPPRAGLVMPICSPKVS
jgi:hypothetical protein